MTDIPPPPLPLERPKLAAYLWSRDLSFQDAARYLGRTREWVRLICLPFDDARRRIPDQADIERIHAWTDGEITPADFYAPHMRAPAPAPAEANP